MKRIVFVFIQCLFFFSLPAKDSGYAIRNYSPKDYNGFNQVWCSVQDNNGIMYFGTSTNIFAYDGKSWTPIPVVSGNAIRSLWRGEDGIIYVGSYGSFGYLEKKVSGQLVYHELSNQLPEPQKKFTDVWKVYTLNGEVVFQTSEGVYFFRDFKYVTSILSTKEKTFALSFSCNGHLYIRHRQVGIQEIINHQLQTVPGGEIFADERCLEVIPWKGGEFALLTGDSGFYSFSPSGKKGFHQLHLPADKYLKDCFALGAKYIDSATICISSRNGIGFLDLDGNFLGELNMEDGLIDNSVSCVIVDHEGQLWLTTGNGISHVFYHSTAHYFRPRESGYEGDVNSITEYKEHIYLASTAGLFRSTGKSNEKHNFFELIEFRQTELWALLVAGEDLLIATSDGVAVYTEGKSPEYISTAFSRDIIFNRDSTIIFSAELGGVRAFQKKDGKWETVSIAEIPGEQQSILVSQYNYSAAERVWSIGRSGILYRVDFTPQGNTIRSFSTESGIKENVSMFCIVGDSACVKTQEGVYVYQAALDKGEGSLCFLPSPGTNKIISKQTKGIAFNCTEKGKLMQTSEVTENFHLRRFGFFKKNKSTGLYDSKFLNLAECPPEDFIFSYVDSHGNFWLSYAGIITRYDDYLPPSKQTPFPTMITHVTVGKDSTLFSGFCTENTTGISLSYDENNVTFRFAAPFFNHEELTSYRYMLEGFDKTWSQYSSSAEKEYTNLPEGDYVFLVRSVSMFGDEGLVGKFYFTIRPPWYRTLWAYSIYLIVFVSTIYLSIRLGAQRLRAQKEKLEIVVAERTAEVVLQKQKIETQNFELESAYKGIQDSIVYAERIQHAILPVQAEISNSFRDSFVLFRPRDIVSGDFYWFVKRGNLSWIACVDCTGHGVPGAFMSMIGNTLLNEIVLEKNIEAPDEILNLLHLRIRQALRQDVGGETRDGMDISLCLFNHQEKKLSYAGANRPLWIVRGKEFIEFSPDKFSIGGDQGAEERIFSLHETSISVGDCIYLSSDGYADQFGGEKGKKFMVKRFQQLLQEICELPMAEQHSRLEKAFLDWKGQLEQVDDVLVIGLRVD